MSSQGEEPRPKSRKLVERIRPLSSLPLNHALDQLLTSGQMVDVIFVIGRHGHRQEIPAHRCILAARSQVLGAMVDDQPNNSEKSGENVVKIEIGPEINPTAFEQLVKFIYNDNVEGCLQILEFEDLFDLRVLAETYGFIQLKEGASRNIALELVKNYAHCYLTLEKELVDKDLRNLAFSVLKRNLLGIINSDELLKKWTPEIWDNLLNDDLCLIEEIDLFRNLCRWRDHDQTRRQIPFQELLKLVRFPLMSPLQLLTEVRLTFELNRDELLDILQAKLCSTTPAPENPRIPLTMEKRNKIAHYVSSSETLNGFCKDVSQNQEVDHLEVVLLPGDYFGDMTVSRNHLKLSGFGPYTILQGLHSALCINAEQTTLDNITILSTMFILEIPGDNNVVRNVRLGLGNRMFGLEVDGDNNTLQNFHSNSYSPFDGSQLEFKSDMSKFTEFCQFRGLGTFCPELYPARFVSLFGNCNKIFTFNFKFESNSTIPVVPLRYQTAFFVRGKDSIIHDVNFEVSKFFEKSVPNILPRMGARLNVWDVDEGKTEVSCCCFAELQVNGKDVNFANVAIVSSATIKGSGHKFMGCKFGQIVFDGDSGIKIVDCKEVPEWHQVVKTNAEIYGNM